MCFRSAKFFRPPEFLSEIHPEFSIVAEPLRKLCRQNVKFECMKSEQKEAFAELKSRVVAFVPEPERKSPLGKIPTSSYDVIMTSSYE